MAAGYSLNEVRNIVGHPNGCESRIPNVCFPPEVIQNWIKEFESTGRSHEQTMRLVAACFEQWVSDSLLLMHMSSLIGKPIAIKDLPKGWRSVRAALLALLKTLNNGASSPVSIALDIARRRLKYLGDSELMALDIINHNHTLESAGRVSDSTKGGDQGAGRESDPAIESPFEEIERRKFEFTLAASTETIDGCALTGNTVTGLIQYYESIKDVVIPKMPLVMAGTWHENELSGHHVGLCSDSLMGPHADKSTIGPNVAQQAQKMAFPHANGLPTDNSDQWQRQGLEKYSPLVNKIMTEMQGKD